MRRHTVTLCLLLVSLSTMTATAQSPRPAASVLPIEHARMRASRIGDVGYHLQVRLSRDLPEYAGSVEILFELDNTDGDLTLDFTGGTVYSMTANGNDVDFDYNGFYIVLPESVLRLGSNIVQISYSRPYSDDGTGLYRFIDPEDDRAYLYTDFEPYNQNQLFPSFDQPDLKARYTTEVIAPASWTVIANVREASIQDAGDERIWRFPQTMPISTYIYALHAGDYHVWESTAGRIPLRLFAREAMVPYVHAEHWFDPTRQGLAFFQDYFELPYPFGKYDQVIVPHFNPGAMENVAAVTFNERYLRRGAVTRQDRRSITSVILHEMAHMWFGDLVTMDWWNGLWLNESFATVMSVLAMVDATGFTDEWEQSYLATVRAYQADERDTTHPIELPVPDTDAAFANFDAITYQKGSATLVQLMHLVGPESFRRGVARYLRRHEYANTSIDDFLGAVSEAADRDLKQWADDWLLQPGTNSVEVELSCRDGRIDAMTVVQRAPENWPTLRTHRTQLGLYQLTDDQVSVQTIPVTYSGERTAVGDARGLACPDLVYANHGDWDFVRVRLAPATLASLDGRLSAFDDPLTRIMLWQSIWDLVLDARMPISDYADFALDNLPQETNEAARRQILGALASSLGYLQQMPSAASRLGALQSRVESFLWERMQAAEPGGDEQLLYYDTYVSTATSNDALERVSQLLTDPATVPAGISLDQDRRWSLLGVLARSGHATYTNLFADESARDRSDAGQRRAITIATSLPDPALKQERLDALLDSERIDTLAEFRAVAIGMFPRGQHELRLEFSEQAMAGLRALTDTRDAEFLSAYGALLGPVCSDVYLDRLERTLEGSTELHPIIVRRLMDVRFEVARCLRMSEVEANAG